MHPDLDLEKSFTMILKNITWLKWVEIFKIYPDTEKVRARSRKAPPTVKAFYLYFDEKYTTKAKKSPYLLKSFSTFENERFDLKKSPPQEKV